MPQSLAPIPAGVAIVDETGAITDFYRLLWQSLINGFINSATIAAVSLSDRTTAKATTAAYTTVNAGVYRVSFAMHKTIADGVSSSLTMTIGWLRNGIALSQAFAALTTDTTAAQQNGSVLVYADANTDITYAISYASNTPNLMTYEANVVTEYLP